MATTEKSAKNLQKNHDQFKPMKGDDAVDDKLVFPYMLTPKYDGHRCLIKDGVAVTSSLKPFPNLHIQACLGKPEYEGLDGELVVGDPTSANVFRDTSKGVRAVMGTPAFSFYVFDVWDSAASAKVRYELMQERCEGLHYVEPVTMTMCRDATELDHLEEQYIEAGYEGVMLRHPESPYKQGRSTVKENYLLKVKRFLDSEAEIIGFTEQEQNTNEKKVNELGRGQRSSAKAGKVGKNTLGTIKVRGVNGHYKDVEFEIGTGFSDSERLQIWSFKESFIGKFVTYKYQAVGNYDKPRIPVFKAFRVKGEF